MEVCSKGHDPMPKNSLGWDIYPKGLYLVLKKLKRFDLPVVITENGICTADDTQRWQFIREHLKSVHQALQEGVKVKGYLYWSMMDNFEWHQGFGPRFGIVGIDYTTQERQVRDSALQYAKVCRTGILA
jgi:beta-glucosidase